MSKEAAFRKSLLVEENLPEMLLPRTIDIHAHILDRETVHILQKETPAAGFKLAITDPEIAQVEFAGVVRPLPRGGWDLERRLQDMDSNGFDLQVLSIYPQTFLYGLEAKLALAVAQIQNDQIAALTKLMPDRFMGIATLPMQAPELAADEMHRAMTKRGLRGVQIGANINGRNLDNRALEPVWAMATQLNAFILVHPMNASGVPGIDSYYLHNLIGNPLDTTVAAASLVFGGVLERHPKLTFCMAHGGGFVPYQTGRFLHGWRVRNEPKVHMKNSPEASFKKLLFDTILHDPRPLQFLVDMVGSSRVFLGSDYPFDMGQYNIEIVRSLDITDQEKIDILRDNAVRLLDGARTGQI